MKEIILITIGALKDKNWEAIENHYLKQIKRPKLTIIELKTQKENKFLEAKVICEKVNSLKKNANPFIALMTEHGKTCNSEDFSSWIFSKLESDKTLILIIGGPSGFDKEVYDIADEKISLSPMTFPHKMARVILIEQIYRAIMIQNNHPYHK